VPSLDPDYTRHSLTWQQDPGDPEKVEAVVVDQLTSEWEAEQAAAQAAADQAAADAAAAQKEYESQLDNANRIEQASTLALLDKINVLEKELSLKETTEEELKTAIYNKAQDVSVGAIGI
jgi:hypothetical protein